MKRRRAVALAGAPLLALSLIATAAGSPASQSLLGWPGHELQVEQLAYDRGGLRTEIHDQAGNVLASMTVGARTVVIQGPDRTLAEPGLTSATVTTSSWVRLLPQPWQPGDENSPWFPNWLEQARSSTEPDAIEIAFQYAQGAPDAYRDGTRFRGDAGFGPLDPKTGKRKEGADFYDYLETDWTFPDGTTRRLDSDERGDVDCSGFVRLVFGYRLGVPLHADSNSDGRALPRQAKDIAAFGPGTLIEKRQGSPITDYSLLQTGDLVFFDTSSGGTGIHHTGIYLGRDNRGSHRFISSRATVDGPTMSDVNGTSVLDDGRYYSKGFVAIRRI